MSGTAIFITRSPASSPRPAFGWRSSTCAAGIAGRAPDRPRSRAIRRDCAAALLGRAPPAASCWRSIAAARIRPRRFGADGCRDRAVRSGAPSRMTCASFSARLAASWMPPLRPMPPIGLLTCAASPASSTRPLRKRRCDALMRHVKIAMHDLVGARRREKRLHARLHAGIAHDVGFGLLGAGRERPCATDRADRRPTP